MSITCKHLIQEIKQNDEDFEFYPTTREILSKVSGAIIKDYADFHGDGNVSLLDIGAGNGNVFKLLDEIKPGPRNEYSKGLVYKKYAIEKSKTLIDHMDADVFIIGTDFDTQTLIDKRVDVIFCNPPYSQYREWTTKILKEANCKYIYLVIPERWKENKQIQSIIKQRDIAYKIMHETDFCNSEYRKARVEVSVIKFHLKSDMQETDPFEIWFKETFQIDASENKCTEYESEQSTKNRIHEVVKGGNLIERLEELYNEDLEKLLRNYKALETLDFGILKELNVNLTNLKEALKLKIAGLKNLYWEELFDNFDTITDRLTKNSREQLLHTLTQHTSVDFTAENAYAIVLWVIKNSNKYIDSQLLDVYMQMSDRENVINYQSNKRFIEDGWRYNKRELSHYTLDYRLVFKRYNNFDDSGYRKYDYPNELSRSTHDYIKDIITIGKNLGFEVVSDSYHFDWSPGEEQTFYNKDNSVFMKIRAYKNGNIHCKPNKDFIKKLNIEAGRLNKWIKTPQEAAEEMSIPLEDVMKSFKSNYQIEKSNVLLIA